MKDSKNSFGTTSRFAQLSYPRKVAVGGLALLLGFAIADPSFLTGSSFSAAYEFDQDDDVDSLLAKMDGKKDSGDAPGDTFAAAEVADTTPGLTIPSYESSTGVIQNASFPKTQTSDSFPELPEYDSPLSIPGAVDSNTASSNFERRKNAVGSAEVSIRFMGTIYPAN